MKRIHGRYGALFIIAALRMCGVTGTHIRRRQRRVFIQSTSAISLPTEDAIVHHRFDEDTLVVATLSEEKIHQLMSDGLTIHDDTPRYPLHLQTDSESTDITIRQLDGSPEQIIPDGISMVQAPRVWKYTQGKGIKICVIDTGVDEQHEDLAEGLVHGDPDFVGHGTHVAGILAGQDNSIGIVGMAPKSQLHMIQIFTNDGKQAYASDVIAAVSECADVGSSVINLSLGGSEPNAFEMQTLDQLLKERGIISVAASGNSGSHSFQFPASYSDVISVAAVNGQNEDNTVAHFSQHNSQVDIAAPGVDVFSTLPMNGTCVICDTLESYSYGSLTGTSTATPHVVGAIALLLGFKDNKDRPGRVVDAILNTAMDLGDTGRDDFYGHGLVQVYTALEELNGGPLVDEDADGTDFTHEGLVISIPQIERKNNNARCPVVGQVSVDFVIRTDAYPQDTTFTLLNRAEDKLLWDFSGLRRNQQYHFHRCIEDDLCYVLTINDYDGLCCQYGLGGWKVTYNDDHEEKGQKFNNKVEIRLGPCDDAQE